MRNMEIEKAYALKFSRPFHHSDVCRCRMPRRRRREQQPARGVALRSVSVVLNESNVSDQGAALAIQGLTQSRWGTAVGDEGRCGATIERRQGCLHFGDHPLRD